MIKILVVGNSFGEDSVRYLYGIARASGTELKVVNLYIGGCSLYRHYRNMLSEEAAYAYEINGMSTGLYVSLKQALLMEEWTHIVLQQCSPESGEYERYQPYLNELTAYVRRLCPPAKVGLNMTWTFADGCSRFHMTPFAGRDDMMPAIVDAYAHAAEDMKADFLLPTGRAMSALYEAVGAEMYRDGFHSHLGFTRYMIGCLWYMAFTGKDIAGNTFRDFDVPTTEEQVALAQKTAASTYARYGIAVPANH